jgi:hypothetical protein
MFEVTGKINDVVTCHCDQCRKTSGHFTAFIIVPSTQMEMLRFETLTWFESMDEVTKGFCTACGSSLFWNLKGRDGWSVSAGAFDYQTGSKINYHCFTSEKGDYYDICDGRPQAPQFDVGITTTSQSNNPMKINSTKTNASDR